MRSARGHLLLPESQRHVSFWNLVYDEHQWAQEHRGATSSCLYFQADTVRRKLSQELTSSPGSWIKAAANPFVMLRNGELHLKRMDALEVRRNGSTGSVKPSNPSSRIRIEDLLRDVDQRCGFTQTFRPLPVTNLALRTFIPTLLAAMSA